MDSSSAATMQGEPLGSTLSSQVKAVFRFVSVAGKRTFGPALVQWQTTVEGRPCRLTLARVARKTRKASAPIPLDLGWSNGKKTEWSRRCVYDHSQDLNQASLASPSETTENIERI